MAAATTLVAIAAIVHSQNEVLVSAAAFLAGHHHQSPSRRSSTFVSSKRGYQVNKEQEQWMELRVECLDSKLGFYLHACELILGSIWLGKCMSVWFSGQHLVALGGGECAQCAFRLSA